MVESEKVIQVKELVRDYTSYKGIFKKEKHIVRAVDQLSFDVNKGEIFGLLGSNGAGKTTTIKILTTLLAPSSGEVRVLGFDPMKKTRELRSHINFVYGGERSLYWRITARENLDYFSDLYKVDKVTRRKRNEELLELVGLKDRADERVETFSKGMKQRLQIARSLVNDPDIIFLDEPTIGLDPIGARDLRKIVKNLASLGKTVLITTHYMYEADEICDRVAIINKGELVALDKPENLKKVTNQLSIIEILTQEKNETLFKELQRLSNIEVAISQQSGDKYMISLHCKNPGRVYNDLLPVLCKYTIYGIQTREASLEDVYIHYVS